MKTLVRWLRRIVIALVVLSLALTGLVYWLTYHPSDKQAGRVRCAADTPVLKSGQPVRVLSWNVQYLAGDGYVFYYDLPNGDGPDERPSKASIAHTLDDVVRVIGEEDPDIVQLQEVDRGSKRTDNADQLALIRDELGAKTYPCTATAFYHKVKWLPHPHIMGSVGMSLSVLSKTKIASATRYQLPQICGDPVTVAFNFDRAVLSVKSPTDSGKNLTTMVTHLDAFAQGCDTMQRQVGAVEKILKKTPQPWLISGDFNLLATDSARAALQPAQRVYFAPKTELAPLLRDFHSYPDAAQVDSGDPSYFTHFPNDPAVGHADRTIDYFFYSDDLAPTDQKIRQITDPRISDHFPMLTTVLAP